MSTWVGIAVIVGAGCGVVTVMFLIYRSLRASLESIINDHIESKLEEVKSDVKGIQRDIRTIKQVLLNLSNVSPGDLWSLRRKP